MGRRSAEAEENHWPGFVDALSTIVMVVTFLLIILAVVIAVLAQNVSKSHLASQSEKSQTGGGDVQTIDPLNVSSTRTFEANLNTSQEPAQEQAEAKQESQSESQSDGSIKSQSSETLKAEEVVDGNTALSVLSSKIGQEEERIEIAKTEVENNKNVKVVNSSNTALTLAFDNISIKIDEASATKITDFISTNKDLNIDKNITIWSFGDASSSSISEQKRIIYYRALAARNELLKNGFSKEKIKVEVRFTAEANIINTVRVVVN